MIDLPEGILQFESIYSTKEQPIFYVADYRDIKKVYEAPEFNDNIIPINKYVATWKSSFEYENYRMSRPVTFYIKESFNEVIKAIKEKNPNREFILHE